MLKTIPLIAGTALLFAGMAQEIAGAALLFTGMAQAATPEAQGDPEYTKIANKKAPAGDDTKDASGNRAAKAADQELHPDARPVYLDGGHFGGDNGDNN